jgi:hypothetical protein
MEHRGRVDRVKVANFDLDFKMLRKSTGGQFPNKSFVTA